jgi:hypothetical protein
MLVGQPAADNLVQRLGVDAGQHAISDRPPSRAAAFQARASPRSVSSAMARLPRLAAMGNSRSAQPTANAALSVWSPGQGKAGLDVIAHDRQNTTLRWSWQARSCFPSQPVQFL